MDHATILADLGIHLRNHHNGNHKTRCPQCSDTRKNRRDPCLSVTVTDREILWCCHNCGWKGGRNDREPEQRRPGMGAKPRYQRGDTPHDGRRKRYGTVW